MPGANRGVRPSEPLVFPFWFSSAALRHRRMSAGRQEISVHVYFLPAADVSIHHHPVDDRVGFQRSIHAAPGLQDSVRYKPDPGLRPFRMAQHQMSQMPPDIQQNQQVQQDMSVILVTAGCRFRYPRP